MEWQLGIDDTRANGSCVHVCGGGESHYAETLSVMREVNVTAAAMGRDAVIVLGRAIERLKGGDRLGPVTIVPPNALAGLSIRRSLGMRPGGIVNVRTLVLSRLIELIGSPALASEGRRPLSSSYRVEAIRTTISGTSEELLGDVPLDGPALRSLDVTFSDFDACDEEALGRIAAKSERHRYLVDRYHEFRSRVRSFYDERDLVSAATTVLARDAVILRDIGCIVLYMPGDLTPPQQRFVGALSERIPLEVVVGLSGDSTVDGHALSAWPEPKESVTVDGPPTASRILQAPDAEEEIREAIRQLCDRVSKGRPLYRAAILYAHRDPYQRIAAEQLAAADIPWNGRLPITFGQTIVGRTLLSLLQITERSAATPTQIGWNETVAPWLSGAPILGSRRQIAPAARWNQIARRANLHRDSGRWLERLAQYRTRLEDEHAEFQQDAEDEQPWRALAMERELAELRDFEDFVRELGGEIQSVPRTADWSAYADRADVLLERYVGGRNAFAVRLGVDGSADVEREVEAWDAVHELLQSLAQLDELGETDPACFRAAVERGLDRPAGRVGRFGRGVFLGPLSAAAGTDWDIVFIVGAADRSLPGLEREDPLLTEPLRSEVGLSGARDRARRRLSEYLAALWSAEERHLSYPRADVRGQRARFPSRWLLESATNLHGERVFGSKIDALDSGGWYRAIPSFEWSIANAPTPGAGQEYDLRSIRRAAAPEDHFLARSEPQLRRGMLLQQARRSDSFSEWDGHIVGGTPSYAQRPHSPSSLQDWAVCPYRYFLGRVLRVAERDEAEDDLTISPLERGALIHDILHTFFSSVEGLQSPNDKWTESHRRNLEAIANDKCDAAERRGVTGRDLLWRRERQLIQDDLQEFLSRDNKRRSDRGVVQVGSEYAFGLAGIPPVSFALPDGRTAHLRGKIDRIDRSADGGRLEVIDYKTGRPSPTKNALSEDPVIRGQYLQLPVYAVAAAQQRSDSSRVDVAASYWFITDRGKFSSLEVPWDDRTAERFRDVLGRIVDGIGQGHFPVHPGDDVDRGPQNCKNCAYDAVCSRDRQDNWNATCRDPRLEGYVALVDGEAT